MNGEPLVNHRDSMAKEFSHTVANSNSYTSVPDCLSSLTINILLLLMESLSR